MFCGKCGATIAEGMGFCTKCGTPVQSGAQAPRSSAAPTASAPSAAPFSGEPQTDGKALGSFILGILSMVVLSFLAGIPAVILGHMSRSSIRKSMGRLKGDGLALAGLIMGYISVALIPMVLIIAAIAIPNLLRARIRANEGVAAATVRTLNTAEVIYSTDYPATGYASDLATLGPGPSGVCPGTGPSSKYACQVDATLGCTMGTWCTKGGYRYSVQGICSGGVCTDYVISAAPISSGLGETNFCSVSDAVVRYRTGEPLYSPLGTVTECASWAAM